MVVLIFAGWSFLTGRPEMDRVPAGTLGGLNRLHLRVESRRSTFRGHPKVHPLGDGGGDLGCLHFGS